MAVSLNRFSSHRSNSASMSSPCCFRESGMHFPNGERSNTFSGVNLSSSAWLYLLDSFLCRPNHHPLVQPQPGTTLLHVHHHHSDTERRIVFLQFFGGIKLERTRDHAFPGGDRSISSSDMTSHSVASPRANS